MLLRTDEWEVGNAQRGSLDGGGLSCLHETNNFLLVELCEKVMEGSTVDVLSVCVVEKTSTGENL